MTPRLRDEVSGAAALLLLLVPGCGAGYDAGASEGDPNEVQSDLILNVYNGADDVWRGDTRLNISYCISRNFGDYYLRAVHEMHQATQEWEKAAYVNFVYKGEHDSECVMGHPSVTFAVLRDVDGELGDDGTAAASAFFPSMQPTEGRLLIRLPDYDWLEPEYDLRTSAGAFAHELGHVLGFRHEHARPEAHQAPYNYSCGPDPEPYRTIAGFTQYDPYSIMHYGRNGCGPLKPSALTSTDRGAAFKVYPAPLRCEVWSGATKLGQTAIAPTSASDGENRCRSYATNTFQRNGQLFSSVERRGDHYRALMKASSSKPCAFTDSVMLWTPGVGFRRPSDVVSYEFTLGKVEWDPADPVYDGYLMARFGGEASGQVGYLYDTTSGFMKNELSRSVTLCGNDKSMSWQIAREDMSLYEHVDGQAISGTMKALSYGSFSLSVDGMGGNDSFYGGSGVDVFTDLSGDNSANGFGGNDTLRLCNYSAIDCGSGGSDKAQTCASDSAGSVVGCELRTTF